MSVLPQLTAEQLRRLLKPLIRLFVRSAHSFQTFQAISKELFVEVSSEELLTVTEKVNVSRISAQTGINRQEVNRILEKRAAEALPPVSFVQKLVGLWERDAKFATKAKKPRVLSYEGAGSEFEQLVYKVSQHLNVGTVLFTLESKKIVERTPRGLRLNTNVFFNSGDTGEIMRQLAFDFDALLNLSEENLKTVPGPCHHLQTQYDNVRPDQLQKIRDWFHREGRKFHKRAREFLSRFDMDVNPLPDSKQLKGGRVILGSYGWTTIGSEKQPE